MKISVTSTAAAFLKDLEQTQKDLRFAAIVALTKTAQAVKTAEVDLMRRKFDRPTPFTLNSLQVLPATKDKPEATVETKEGFGSVPAGRFLNPEVEGGARSMKSHEKKLRGYTSPSTFAKLDKYGNFPASTYVKILSQLKLSGDQSATNSKRSTAKRSREAFFRRENIIYSRKKDDITPALIITDAPHYQPRLPFYVEAERTVDQVMPLEMDKAVLRYVK